MLPPPAHTPLVALPVLVLDLETTGLDVKNDRVIQVGAITLQGEQIIETPQLNQLIRPGVAIPAATAAIHGIRDQDVETAPAFADIVQPLKDLLSGRVVVGQHIGFDIAILRHEFARLGLVWHEPAMIDISQLVGALQPALPELSLEAVCRYLGVEIHNRHSAMGDCLAAAHAWQKLMPLLREKDIRTLGETLALANQRQDLLLRQAQSGWLATPEALVTASTSALTRIDSYIFEQQLQDVMTRSPQSVAPTTSLRDAAKNMVQLHIGCLLVCEEQQPPQGIVTESDLMRASAEHRDFDHTPVSALMSTPVHGMPPHELLYRALARMDRLGISHLCVVDANDRPLGIVSQRDLLRYRARGPHMLSDALQAADTSAALASAYARVTAVATQLVNEGLDGSQVARVISAELQALTERATQLSLMQMQRAGKGTAPADWCVIVLGSGGRAESLLSADQDNALIHRGGAEHDAWFAEFGELLAETLDAAGLPRCKGGVMVRNRQWRGTEQEWAQRVEHWLRRARPDDLLNVDIFFDLVAVAGNAELAQQLHHSATQLAANSSAFTNLLAQSVQAMSPRFSLFGRPSLQNGRVDLKRDGLLPLVCFARTLALRLGSVARATPERLYDVLAAGHLAEGDVTRLVALHKKLLSLIVQQQIQDIDNGITASSLVEVKSLNRSQYQQLLRELRHLHTMVGEIQSLIAR
ncbi:MAG: DUF294 nucleotidyltransferase-like domain-containing protein [Gammaproteobacteria bacterium]